MYIKNMAVARVVTYCINPRLDRVLIYIFIFTLLSCSNRVEISWKEDVLLSNGEIIQVERSAAGKKQYELGRGSWWEPDKMILSFHNMEFAGSHVEFSSKLIPIIFDYDTSSKEFYVIGALYTCEDWKAFGHKTPPYVEYRYRNGKWVDYETEQRLVGHKANLLIAPEFSNKLKNISVREKEERNKSSDEYFRIVVEEKNSSC